VAWELRALGHRGCNCSPASVFETVVSIFVNMGVNINLKNLNFPDFQGFLPSTPRIY
jgi:hypothetical protein